MKIFYLFLTFLFIGCSNTKDSESFELTLTSCYEMRADKTHRYWKQPIAVQGCDLLIMEYEHKELEENK